MRITDESRSAGYGALLWLALATFSMGIDGYVLAGLLPQIASRHGGVATQIEIASSS